MEERRFGYKGYVFEPRSYHVLKGPDNPAGWAPHAWLWRNEWATVETFPLSLPSKIVGTQEEADKIAIQMACQWIDKKG